MSQAPALRVFISYARRDCAEFADELLAGLEVAGFDPFLDRHDIAAGEDWEARLGGLIESADTVVFVVSPGAVASERCAWEVAKAESLSKRIIPIVAVETPEADTPAGLKRLNYIFFTAGHSFARSLGDLAKALRVDLDWIREHTRLAELATRWRDRDKAEVLLLRGSELEAAKAWLNGWKPGAPEPSDLHRAFIAESDVAEGHAQSAERKRLEEKEAMLRQLSRRTAFGLAGAGGLAAVAAGFALWGVQEREGREVAEARSIDAVIQAEASRTDIVGQVTATAASPGQNAADGAPGGNSPYTTAVLEQLRDPTLSLVSALVRAHAVVRRTSELRQRPFLSTDLDGDIYLARQPETRQRKAIIVSVDTFGEVSAPNTVRDAIAWADFLGAQGFQVIKLSNPSRQDILDALTQATQSFDLALSRTFEVESAAPPTLRRKGIARRVTSGPANTLIAFVYAGLGASKDGRNYIAPHVASEVVLAEEQAELFQQLIDVGWLSRELALSAAASMMILDTNFADYWGGR